MIVDDDVDDLDYFTASLFELDPSAQCIRAHHGLEAIQLLKHVAFYPHYIFIDLNMPNVSGKELIREIRKNPEYDSIKLIVYSTSKSEKDETECRKLGASGFIKKPSSFNEFSQTIRKLLNPY